MKVGNAVGFRSGFDVIIGTGGANDDGIHVLRLSLIHLKKKNRAVDTTWTNLIHPNNLYR